MMAPLRWRAYCAGFYPEQLPPAAKSGGGAQIVAQFTKAAFSSRV